LRPLQRRELRCCFSRRVKGRGEEEEEKEEDEEKA
jgi:hypothetical protein